MFLTSKVLQDLQASLVADAWAFRPELMLCGTIVLLLLLRLFSVLDRWHLGWVALLCTLAAFGTSWVQWLEAPTPTTMGQLTLRTCAANRCHSPLPMRLKQMAIIAFQRANCRAAGDVDDPVSQIRVAVMA